MSENIIAGRYRVLKHKGDNGICSTHFAEDSLSGERLVVKIFADSEPLALEYIKNANLLRDSDPQGEVLAIDGGLLDDPSGFYMAYPLFDSHSLDDYLRVGGTLSPAELGRILRSLVQALRELHERGFLHLFLNPHNVLYTPGSGVMLKDPSLRPEFFNPLLERLASYDYSFFSPELMDYPEGAGQSADIFALGRLIETSLQHAEKPIDSISLEEHDRLSKVASRCTAVDPESRYPTLEAVLLDMPGDSGSRAPVPTQSEPDEHVSMPIPSLPQSLEDSFFFEEFLKDDLETEHRFEIPTATQIRTTRRSRGGWISRHDRFPVLKLALLGATVAIAISILVLGHDLPGKSARSTEESSGETRDTSELEQAEEFSSTASEQGSYGQSDQGAVPANLLVDSSGDTGMQGELPLPAATLSGDENGTPAHPPIEEPVAASQEKPVASFTLSPSSGNSPLQTWLDASSSYDPDGTIVSYEWSFGGTGLALYHVFESNILPCTIPITLTVTDSQGLNASATHFITIF